MTEPSDWEIRLVKDYATKEDLGRVEGKLDSVDKRVHDQGSTLALVEYKLKGILDALNRIVWLIATPLLSGTIAALIWAATQIVK